MVKNRPIWSPCLRHRAENATKFDPILYKSASKTLFLHQVLFSSNKHPQTSLEYGFSLFQLMLYLLF